ncbi:hypothetical protein BJ165DRAFT_761378 [Panaeolus papilionaceus]|nr:hypothetical protein BJ165DRAFT_761378 [Panaeolus papilionaceus]
MAEIADFTPCPQSISSQTVPLSMADSIPSDPTTTMVNEAPAQCQATHPSSPEPVCDDVFYYEVVYIQVGGSLFCIPKEHLNVPGSVFSQMFIDGTPSNVSNVAEGSHRSNPIVLEGIDQKKFRSFLKGAWKRNDVEILIMDWMNILALAHQWNFKKLKKEAIIGIESSSIHQRMDHHGVHGPPQSQLLPRCKTPRRQRLTTRSDHKAPHGQRGSTPTFHKTCASLLFLWRHSDV